MKRWAVEVMLLFAVVGFAAAADQRLRAAQVVGVAGRPLAGPPATPRLFDIDSLTAASDAVSARDPFRLPGARPGPVVAAGSLARAPRPQLTLKAIVGGPPWQAVLAGVPGNPGDMAVVAGDRVGALVVRSIGRDTVVVTGADTTWMLTLSRDRP